MVGYKIAFILLLLSLVLVAPSSAVHYNAAGTLSTITDYPKDRWEIDINEDNIVWVESGGDYGEQILYLHNIDNQKTQKIASSKYSSFHPSIGRNTVLWGGKIENSGPVRLIRYDIIHGNYTLVDPYPSNQDFPASEDGIVVWLDSRTGGYANIYINEGEDVGNSLFYRSDTSDKHNPVINEGYVYWVEKGTLFRKNIKSGNPETLIQGLPNEYSVSGKNIVWEFEGDYGKDLALLDIDAMIPRPIVAKPGEQLNPDISLNNIVWQESVEDQNNIRIKNLNTGIVADIYTSPSVQSGPEISDSRIVWFDSTSGIKAVKVFELDNYAAPSAEFTSDAKPSLPPLSVNFATEITTPVNIMPDLLWDLGDGTITSETEPSHTYTTPGIYNVTLTVSNEYGKHSIFKPSHVVIGELPVPDFTSEKRAGEVPLTVKFIDDSTGPYETRMWSFGDGIGSILKNPLHTYSKPGHYTVTLTLSNEYGSVAEERVVYISAGEEPSSVISEAEKETAPSGFPDIFSGRNIEIYGAGIKIPSFETRDLREANNNREIFQNGLI